MKTELFTAEQVKEFNTARLVGQFEVACKMLHYPDITNEEYLLRNKNFYTLRDELYRRLPD